MTLLDTASAKPLYEQIKDYILLNIQSGVYTPGTRIPSERALSDTFGVSRLTVKRALDELTQNGVLTVQIGKGTYINRPKVDQQLDTLTSFTEEMSKRGQRVVSKVLSSGYVPATLDEARILSVLPSTSLAFLMRLRLADDTPMAIEHSKLVAVCCPGIIEQHDFSRESLYDVLRRVYAVHLTRAEQSIEARRATDSEARLLRIEPGEPILQITRVTFSDGDQPIEYVQSAYCGGRYKFQAVLRRL